MAAPVITSDLEIAVNAGAQWSYQITASNTPTSYNATGLPGGVSVDTDTGIISGYPVMEMDYSITISASNDDGTGTATLELTVGAPSSSATSFRAARLAEFREMVRSANYGTSFEYLGSTYTCIADPQVISYVMNPNGYRNDIPARFDMFAWEADEPDDNFEASGLEQALAAKKEVVITYNGYQFGIHSFQRDDQDATVVLRGNRKQ